MDWEQIEKDFEKYFYSLERGFGVIPIVNWFKQRIESELPPQPPEKLNEEEVNEFQTTNVTADIKVNYGK